MVVSTVQETAVPERRSRRLWIGRRPTRAGVLMAADWLIALLVIAAVFPPEDVARAIVAVPLAWLATTGVYNLYERRHLGPGSEEVRRVLRAAFAATAVACAVCALFLHRDKDVRSVLLVIPLTAVVSIIVRRTVHTLARSRADDVVHRALLVGPLPQALELAKALGRDASGLRAVALCPTAEDGADASDAAPAILDVLGDPPDWERLATAARQTGCDSVIVIPGPHLTPAALSGLGWRLGQQGTELIVAPFVSEIATSRLAVRNNGGVPMLHVKSPEVSRVSRLPKEIVERLAAGVVLVLASPVIAGIALAIIATDGRPVLFRQRRVGRDAEEFTMLKFRTMVRNADQVKAGLAHLNLNSDGVLFKMKSDPRDHQGGRRPAALLPGRGAAAVQRRGRLHVAGGTAAAAAGGGRQVLRRGAPPSAGQAGPDRPVADQRALRPPLGGGGPPGPVLRRELVAGHGRAHLAEDPHRDGEGHRRLLNASN